MPRSSAAVAILVHRLDYRDRLSTLTRSLYLLDQLPGQSVLQTAGAQDPGGGVAILAWRHSCDDLAVVLVMVVARVLGTAPALEVALQPLHPPLLVLQGGAQVGRAVGELNGVQEVGGGWWRSRLRVLRAGGGAAERAQGCHWQIGRAEREG